MDRLGVFGFVLAIVVIVGGQLLEGGRLATLVNLPAALIVFGGTLAAVIIQTPMNTFIKAMQSIKTAFGTPQTGFEQGKDLIVRWSGIARKDGLLGLEDLAARQTDPFVQKALELVVDGAEPATIRSNLMVEVEMIEHDAIQVSKVYEAMGGYAPTMGIVGAVLGLIHVMGNLDNPDLLGPGVATAFVATIYGVASANLLFLPIASKLKAIFIRQSQYRVMFIEGMCSIAEGENPRIIESKLEAFLHLGE